MLHVRERSGTTDAEDVDALINLLLDNLQHKTFTAMVERLLVWRQRCGYQVPINFSMDRSRFPKRPDPRQESLFS